MCKELLCDNRFELRFIEGYCAAAAKTVDAETGARFQYLADRIKAHLAEPTKKRKYTKKNEDFIGV